MKELKTLEELIQCINLDETKRNVYHINVLNITDDKYEIVYTNKIFKDSHPGALTTIWNYDDIYTLSVQDKFFIMRVDGIRCITGYISGDTNKLINEFSNIVDIGNP